MKKIILIIVILAIAGNSFASIVDKYTDKQIIAFKKMSGYSIMDVSFQMAEEFKALYAIHGQKLWDEIDKRYYEITSKYRTIHTTPSQIMQHFKNPAKFDKQFTGVYVSITGQVTKIRKYNDFGTVNRKIYVVTFSDGKAEVEIKVSAVFTNDIDQIQFNQDSTIVTMLEDNYDNVPKFYIPGYTVYHFKQNRER